VVWKTIATALVDLGGVATRRELEWAGVDPEHLTIAYAMGLIWRPRRGLYVARGTHPLVVRALQARGRLACVSALEFLDGDPAPDDRLHIAVAANASRLRVDENVVVHWSRRPPSGSRGSVDRETARRQAASCPALGDPGL
jgi:hypothetical protein